MKIFSLSLAIMCAFSSAASALECDVMTPEWMWHRAKDDTRDMLPVHGRLSRPTGEVTLGGVVALDMRQASFHARFRGHALTRLGFTKSFEQTITVEAACIDPICSDLPYDTRIMTLLTKSGTGWVLSLGPCVDPIIKYPLPEERHRLRDCVLGKCTDLDF